MLNPRFLTVLAMIAAAAATRLIPHPPNMTALGATALFGAAYLNRRWMAFVIPLSAMAASDLILTSPEPMTYVLFALTAALGLLLRGRVTVTRVTLVAIAASAMFYLVSNFWVWLGSTTYPQNATGLIACLIAGLPFAQNMLVGNLFYCGLLFGGMEAAQRIWPAIAPRVLTPVPVRQ